VSARSGPPASTPPAAAAAAAAAAIAASAPPPEFDPFSDHVSAPPPQATGEFLCMGVVRAWVWIWVCIIQGVG